jgi:acyl carrier protein
MLETIRTLIAEHGRLPVSIDALTADQDLYAAGLTSFAAVQLMLALEHRFAVAFPEHMLARRTFASIEAIAAGLRRLPQQSGAMTFPISPTAFAS